MLRLAFGYYVPMQGGSDVRLSTHVHIYAVRVAHALCLLVHGWSEVGCCRAEYHDILLISTPELLHVLQGRMVCSVFIA